MEGKLNSEVNVKIVTKTSQIESVHIVGEVVEVDVSGFPELTDLLQLVHSVEGELFTLTTYLCNS